MPRLIGGFDAALFHCPACNISDRGSCFRCRAISVQFSYRRNQDQWHDLHVRIGGQGPAVVMLHGFGDTGDMWAPAAAVLVKNHMVVVPDLRGMGLSAHPDA